MKNIKTDIVIFLYGPTGVGKTDISLALAQHLPIEIINIDVGQFYTPLSIGTAKPDWRAMAVPHHLFDIIHAPENSTVVQWRLLLLETVNEIKKRKNIPVIVGGSGFYVRSLLFPLHDQQDSSLEVFESDDPTLTTLELWQKLYALDPERATSLQKTDRYRITRALALGGSSTALNPLYNPFSDYYLINISRDVAELNSRINQRVVEMLNSGWLEETEKLQGTEWETFLRHKKIIGYTEILDYYKQEKNKRSFDDLVSIISQRTRQYAKRQRTFWRKLERECYNQTSYQGPFVGCIETMDLTNKPVHLYISELLRSLSSL